MSDFSRWYREGTVSVTNGSDAVVGAATYWSGGIEVRAGDIFFIGDELYEIATIAGDSSITLDRDFTGSTASGLSYAIIRNFNATPAATMVVNQVELIRRTIQREKAYIDWQSLPASVDPMDPTVITFTQYDGNTTDVKSLAQIQDDIDRSILAGSIGPVGPAGITGPPGAGLVWKGAWVGGSVNFVIADAVSNLLPDGTRSSYVCKVPHLSSTITEPGVGIDNAIYWDIITSGARGERGYTGVAGPVGPAGPIGIRGATWTITSGTPSNGLGLDNDLAINTATGAIWRKTAGVWAADGNIRGPQGVAGNSVTWLVNGWVTYASFTALQAIRNGNASYICHTAHTRAASNEPGIGASWASYWSVLIDATASVGVSLPPGGAIGDMIVKTGSGDGAANWQATIPAGAVNLSAQNWAGTSLAALATRSYTDLTSKPIDDNWRYVAGAQTLVASDFYGYDTNDPPVLHDNASLSLSVHNSIVDTSPVGYHIVSYPELINAIKFSITAGVPEAYMMARQDSRAVSITGGIVRGGLASFPGSNGVGHETVSTPTDVAGTWTINSNKARSYLTVATNINLAVASAPITFGGIACYYGRCYFKNTAASVTITLTADKVSGTQPTTLDAEYALDWEWVNTGGGMRLFARWTTYT